MAWLLFGTDDRFPGRFQLEALKPFAGGDGSRGVLLIDTSGGVVFGRRSPQ